MFSYNLIQRTDVMIKIAHGDRNVQIPCILKLAMHITMFSSSTSLIISTLSSFFTQWCLWGGPTSWGADSQK